jgi:hypothetical protein
MKNLRTTVLGVCITLCSLSAAAQIQTYRNNNPESIAHKLFQNQPDNISVNVENLNTLVNTPVGQAVSINLSDKSQFLFEGQVVSASDKDERIVQTVVIRSTNYNGARLTLSKIITDDGTIIYSGRIMSYQHDDLLELKKQDGHYALIKRKYNDLVNE